MRKIVEPFDEGRRGAVLWLADLCIAVFGSAVVVLALSTAVDWFK